MATNQMIPLGNQKPSLVNGAPLHLAAGEPGDEQRSM